MAKQRSRTRSTSNTAPQVENTTNTNSTNNGTTQGESKMAGLTAEQIQQLLSTSRSKGQYVAYTNEFLASNEAGVCVNEQWADLADKKASTLKQGFENAKTNKESSDGADKIKVMVNEDKVYLINLALAGGAAAETTE